MNHFTGILLFAVCVAAIFSLVNRTGLKERVLYFAMLMGYMVAGSLLFSWLMYFLPF